jgi:hypothetical protein
VKQSRGSLDFCEIDIIAEASDYYLSKRCEKLKRLQIDSAIQPCFGINFYPKTCLIRSAKLHLEFYKCCKVTQQD